jgi:hypothetical protein
MLPSISVLNTRQSPRGVATGGETEFDALQDRRAGARPVELRAVLVPDLHDHHVGTRRVGVFRRRPAESAMRKRRGHHLQLVIEKLGRFAARARVDGECGCQRGSRQANQQPDQQLPANRGNHGLFTI